MEWIHGKIRRLCNESINKAEYKKSKCMVKFIPGNINYIFNMKVLIYDRV